MKIFHNEKELHSFLSLLVVGTVLITLFTVMFNIYSIPPCLDPVVCTPNGIPNIRIITTDSIENKNVQPQSTSAYQAYAATHTWATTTPKTSWEKDIFMMYQGSDKCFIATSSIQIGVTLSNYREISFDHIFCPQNTPKFYVEGEPGIVYSNMYSNPESTGSIAFKYWIMKKGENPETLIASIMKVLPTPAQRDHCKLDTQEVTKLKTPKSDIKHYTVSPDNEYIKSQSSDYESYASCYPYISYFQVVGDVLFYIYSGQDLTFFDPDSLKVASFEVPKIQP